MKLVVGLKMVEAVLQDLSLLLFPMPFLKVKAMVTVLSSSQMFLMSQTKTEHGKELSCKGIQRNRFRCQAVT